jgi:signal transduction histidine kinase
MRLSSHRLFLAGAGAFLLVCLGVALFAKPSFWLTAFSDLSRLAIVTTAFVLMARNVWPSRGRARVFWAMMALSCFLWALDSFAWAYCELVAREGIPNFYLGEIARFLVPIPIIAAVAARPDRAQSSRLGVGKIDFILLMLWWVFIYGFAVLVWLYVAPNHSLYNIAFDALMAFESTLLLGVLAIIWLRTRNLWRRLYVQLALAQAMHSLGAALTQPAIHQDGYYTGGIYDIPLIASMLCFVYVALIGRHFRGEGRPAPAGLYREPVWPGHLSALAMISLPILALWTAFLSTAPLEVREFRLIMTLCTMIGLALLVYLKQRALNQELHSLLAHSHASMENVKRVQRQLVNSEKMAALGQLVSGAAHEINNPLTAILGYADILSSESSLTPEPRSLAEKIATQARRTKRLVANLLSFAQRTPAVKTSTNLNTLLEHATQLREKDIQNKSIRITCELAPDLPLVRGDSNHLLQVFLHILNNAVDALQEVGGGLLRVATRRDNEFSVVEIYDTGPGVK